MQIGELTNNGNGDPTRIDYSMTLTTRNWTHNPVSAPFRWNTTGGVTQGQFGGSGYDPISPMSNGMQGTDSRYQVREGDTLATVAASVWGDASLWYMIAEANGLSGSEPLAAGTSLIIPAKVTNIHNSARTFEVYDPNRALGDLSPTAAKPPKKNKCGIFGTIMLVAIAVAVTVITAGAAVAALTPGMSFLTGISTFVAGGAGFGTMVAAGAIGGAMGSIASQGFGVATGIQDKFSWKGVAMSALAGGIGAGIGASGAFSRLSTFARGAISGASGSALSQGIGVVLGLQKKFNFAAVAAAGLAGGVSASAGKALGAGNLSNLSARNIAANLATSAAGAIANAAARSVIQGTSFGDNLLAALPDIIGTTIGNMIGHGIAGSGGGAATSAGVTVGTTEPEAGSTAYDGNGVVEAGELPMELTEARREEILQRAAIRQAEARAAAAPPPPVPSGDEEQEIVITGSRNGGGSRSPVPVAVENDGGFIRQTTISNPLWMRQWRSDLETYLGAMRAKPGATNDPQVMDNYEDSARRILWLDAVVAGADQQLLDVILLGPRIGLGMATATGDFVINGIDYMAGNITFNEMVLNSVPGSELIGVGRRVANASEGLADAAAAERAGRRTDRGIPDTFPLPDDPPFPPGSAGAAKTWTIGSRLRAAGGEGVGLPRRGRFRFMPDEGYDPRNPLPRTSDGQGYVDRFGNEWRLGPSRTRGEPYEWDVSLGRQGQREWGRFARPGTNHVNVSLRGRRTH